MKLNITIPSAFDFSVSSYLYFFVQLRQILIFLKLLLYENNFKTHAPYIYAIFSKNLSNAEEIDTAFLTAQINTVLF